MRTLRIVLGIVSLVVLVGLFAFADSRTVTYDGKEYPRYVPAGFVGPLVPGETRR